MLHGKSGNHSNQWCQLTLTADFFHGRFCSLDEPSIVGGGNKFNFFWNRHSVDHKRLNRKQTLIMHFAGLVGVIAESNPDNQ